MTKTAWYDDAKRDAYVEAAIARVEAALAAGGDGIDAAYAELSPLLERELACELGILPALLAARWEGARDRVHEAHRTGALEPSETSPPSREWLTRTMRRRPAWARCSTLHAARAPWPPTRRPW